MKAFRTLAVPFSESCLPATTEIVEIMLRKNYAHPH